MFTFPTKHPYFALALLAVTASIETPVALAAEPAPDDVIQLEFQETLVDAVPTSNSITVSKQTTPEQEDENGPPMVAIDDPWEGFNRSIYSFNLKADKYVLKPVASAYDIITPEPVQRGVRSFFSNLQSPVILVKELLQGRPMDSAETLGRLAVNTTVGIVWIFDPATSIGLETHKEDFGQTFAVWGWESSNYVVLPFLGPRTLRDTAGFVLGNSMSPLNQVGSDAVALGLKSLEITDMRKQQFAYDELRASALEEYALVRGVWAQKRSEQIQEGDQPQKEQTGKKSTKQCEVRKLFLARRLISRSP
jgi:phospholipid-binding lipoprotein MlaA